MVNDGLIDILQTDRTGVGLTAANRCSFIRSKATENPVKLVELTSALWGS